ncbi:hypothetical protein [Lactiplantibacillus carotarum]|uniref:hypothetical protein n=1 Tax=Lactiplantibacillus carotarum TaxID=2993456 RepID=UPI00298F0245|nr:hypothetical protein [Lactiplantibacillus carotarum]
MRKTIEKFIKKHWLISAAVIVVVVPIIVEWFMTSYFSNTGGTEDGWLGFWGGYLGSVIGITGTIAFTVFYSGKQMEMTREAQVQAYIKQSQIVALRDYEDELDKASEVFMNASNGYGEVDKDELHKKLQFTIDNLQKKCEHYSFLTNRNDAKNIIFIQNNVRQKSEQLHTHILEMLSPQNRNRETEDGKRYDATDEIFREVSEQIFDNGIFIKKCLNEVNEEFNKLYGI